MTSQRVCVLVCVCLCVCLLVCVLVAARCRGRKVATGSPQRHCNVTVGEQPLHRDGWGTATAPRRLGNSHCTATVRKQRPRPPGKCAAVQMLPVSRLVAVACCGYCGLRLAAVAYCGCCSLLRWYIAVVAACCLLRWHIAATAGGISLVIAAAQRKAPARSTVLQPRRLIATVTAYCGHCSSLPPLQLTRVLQIITDVASYCRQYSLCRGGALLAAACCVRCSVVRLLELIAAAAAAAAADLGVQG